jgi:hypothetical protein
MYRFRQLQSLLKTICCYCSLCWKMNKHFSLAFIALASILELAAGQSTLKICASNEFNECVEDLRISCDTIRWSQSMICKVTAALSRSLQHTMGSELLLALEIAIGTQNVGTVHRKSAPNGKTSSAVWNTETRPTQLVLLRTIPSTGKRLLLPRPLLPWILLLGKTTLAHLPWIPPLRHPLPRQLPKFRFKSWPSSAWSWQLRKCKSWKGGICLMYLSN